MNEKLDHDFLVKRNRADLWLRSHIAGIHIYDFHEKYCLNGENCRLLLSSNIESFCNRFHSFSPGQKAPALREYHTSRVRSRIEEKNICLLKRRRSH